MSGGPDITLAAGLLLMAFWWCIPVGYGYGAAAQPIAGKLLQGPRESLDMCSTCGSGVVFGVDGTSFARVTTLGHRMYVTRASRHRENASNAGECAVTGLELSSHSLRWGHPPTTKVPPQ
jgi:hypothetical protein